MPLCVKYEVRGFVTLPAINLGIDMVVMGKRISQVTDKFQCQMGVWLRSTEYSR
jgi:hypothetical protein